VVTSSRTYYCLAESEFLYLEWKKQLIQVGSKWEGQVIFEEYTPSPHQSLDFSELSTFKPVFTEFTAFPFVEEEDISIIDRLLSREKPDFALGIPTEDDFDPDFPRYEDHPHMAIHEPHKLKKYSINYKTDEELEGLILSEGKFGNFQVDF
jgi:hypothetical protein